MDEYKEKLIALCEGLKLQHLDDMLTRDASIFRRVGERITEFATEKNGMIEKDFDLLFKINKILQG